MLEKHSRFHLEKNNKEKSVIVDKFTKQKFISYRVPIFVSMALGFQQEDEVVYPSFLTEDENKLLAYVMNEFRKEEVKILSDKKQKREQQRKDKYRQEMIDLYKEDM